jgi:hypothetical protein
MLNDLRALSSAPPEKSISLGERERRKEAKKKEGTLEKVKHTKKNVFFKIHVA